VETKLHISIRLLAIVVVIIGLAAPSLATVTSAQFIDYGQPVPNGGSITAFVLDTGGKVYGATIHNLFVFDPVNESFTDKGNPPADGIIALTWSTDGKLYGGGWGSTLWTYDPVTDSFSSKGQVPGGRRIIGLTTGLDGLIYVGTEPEADRDLLGRLFSFNPTTNGFADIGGVADENSVGYGLITGPDGKIYGGTYSHGHFFIYDPSNGTFTDRGQPVGSARSIGTLVVGGDGKIYGGTSQDYTGGHLFSYDPVSNSFWDEGQAVAGQKRITCLTAFEDKVYGGTGNFASDSDSVGHIFVYNSTIQSFTDLGVPVQQDAPWWMGDLIANSIGTVYGGTVGQGHFFSYGIPPTLTTNYDTGRPGSFFTITGTNFPPNSTATIIINGYTLTDTITIDGFGSLILLLDTNQADSGRYFVTARVNPSATTDLTLDPDAPLRLQEDSGPVLSVPSGIAFTKSVYLPFVQR
jgi:hypothetical protein